MSVVAYPLPMPKAGNGGFSALGAIVPLGKLHTYVPGTTTPKNTYFSSSSLLDINPNPVILDTEGRADIFVEAGEVYDLRFENAAGSLIWTAEDVWVEPIQTTPSPANLSTGALVMYGGNTGHPAPDGFLFCNGAAVLRAQYAALFAVIGTTYGAGDGITTFNIPNLTQRFPLGKNAAGTGSTLGGTGGAIDHTHTGPSHTHNIAAHHHTQAHTHNALYNGWATQVNTPPLAGILQAGGTGAGSETGVTQANNDNPTDAESVALTGDASLTTDAGGTEASGPANPPFLTLNFLVKT